MLLKKLRQMSKPISTSSASLAWRSRIRQGQLVTHISSLLLQRRNWAPLLQSLDLSSKLTPSIFYHILSITQNDPHLSLNFFNWAKTKLWGFEHDLKSQCLIVCLLLKNSQTVKPMLDSLVKHHPVALLVDSMVRASKVSNFDVSIALSDLLQSYAYNGLSKESMEAFSLIRRHGIVPSVSAYSGLLDSLLRKNEIDWGWCSVGTMIRSSGVWPDKSILNLIATMLSKEGKIDRVRYMLDVGVETCVIYNLLIDSYSRKGGDFRSALDLLSEMCSRNVVDAGFSTYGSILDGACRYKENVVAEKILKQMLEKRLLPLSSSSALLIQKLCDLGRSYAAEMLWSRGLELETASYGSMLRAYSKDGRVKQGIDMYRMICERNITVKEKCYAAFLSSLCRGEPCREVSNIMKDVIERGFITSVVPESDSDLTNYLALLCQRHRWLEVEDLLNVILDRRLAVDFSCCGLLIKRYCSSSTREIDKAVELHNKIELLDGSLDVEACNQLLEGLMKGRKVVEADKIFNYYYMRRGGRLSSRSFVIMIGGLCVLKQLRKAMVYHDEMLQRGLKPDIPTYKRLIAGFS